MKRTLSLLFILTAIFNSLALSPEEIIKIKEEALNGDAFAQYRLTYHFYRAKDYIETRNWGEKLLSNNKASEKDKGEICNILGRMWVIGNGVTASREKGIKLLEEGIGYKNPDCADSMAQLFEINPKYRDLETAFHWYEKCAELGGYRAALMVGNQYEDNSASSYHSSNKYPAVKIDYAKAIHNYELYLDNLPRYLPNPEHKYQYLKMADPKMAFKVADAYFNGKDNISKDYDKAVFYYHDCLSSIDDNRRLINDNCMINDDILGEVLWNLASCYRFGRGVGKNELSARKLIKRSADKGYQKAIDFLNK